MSKISLREAISKSSLNNFSLRFPHLTTQGFGQMAPIIGTEILPRDRFKVNYNYQCLLAPLSTPAFADLKQISRFFFVPMESIFPHFKDMYESSSDASVSSSLDVPYIQNNEVVSYFTSNNLCTRVYNDGNIYFRYIGDSKKKYICDNLGRLLLVGKSQVSSWNGKSQWYMYIDQSGLLQLRPYTSSLGVDTTDRLTDSDGTSYFFRYVYNGTFQTPFQQGQIYVSSRGTATLDNTNSYDTVSLFADTQLSAFYSDMGSSYSYVNGNWNNLGTGSTATTRYARVLADTFFTFEFQSEGVHGYDFVEVYDDMYRFTYNGRYLMNILYGLGYSINMSSSDTTKMSALPIHAYLRVWYDFLYPSAYVQSLGWASFFHSPTVHSTSALLDKLLQIAIVPYKQDYYTAAWKQFMQVGSSVYTYGTVPAFAPTDSNSPTLSVSSTYGVPAINQNAASQTPTLTQYGLKVLSSVTDWLIRNNVAGSRFFEQMEARFGVKGYDVDPTRSMYIDSVDTKVRIGDTLASTETDTQLLGERAGVGSAQGGDTIHFENRTGQFGYFIGISMIMPEIDYYQGRDRQLQHLDKFSFFTPEGLPP